MKRILTSLLILGLSAQNASAAYITSKWTRDQRVKVEVTGGLFTFELCQGPLASQKCETLGNPGGYTLQDLGQRMKVLEQESRVNWWINSAIVVGTAAAAAATAYRMRVGYPTNYGTIATMGSFESHTHDIKVSRARNAGLGGFFVGWGLAALRGDQAKNAAEALYESQMLGKSESVHSLPISTPFSDFLENLNYALML